MVDGGDSPILLLSAIAIVGDGAAPLLSEDEASGDVDEFGKDEGDLL